MEEFVRLVAEMRHLQRTGGDAAGAEMRVDAAIEEMQQLKLFEI